MNDKYILKNLLENEDIQDKIIFELSQNKQFSNLVDTHVVFSHFITLYIIVVVIVINMLMASIFYMLS